MYADYIEHQGGDENSIISAEHIDVLTFNRIDFEKNKTYKVYRQYPGQHEAEHIHIRKIAVSRAT